VAEPAGTSLRLSLLCFPTTPTRQALLGSFPFPFPQRQELRCLHFICFSSAPKTSGHSVDDVPVSAPSPMSRQIRPRSPLRAVAAI
jgi:hypothetical protein